MKWINADKTAGLNLDLIVFWAYKSGSLEVYAGSEIPLLFNGSDAEEIYKMLTSRKEIL
jgi:hypothetical protein